MEYPCGGQIPTVGWTAPASGYSTSSTGAPGELILTLSSPCLALCFDAYPWAAVRDDVAIEVFQPPPPLLALVLVALEGGLACDGVDRDGLLVPDFLPLHTEFDADGIALTFDIDFEVGLGRGIHRDRPVLVDRDGLPAVECVGQPPDVRRDPASTTFPLGLVDGFLCHASNTGD